MNNGRPSSFGVFANAFVISIFCCANMSENFPLKLRYWAITTVVHTRHDVLQMLQWNNMTMFSKGERYPLRRAHFVGTSVVLTIDPVHVKRLEIDDLTFFTEKPIENGIVLEMCKIQ